MKWIIWSYDTEQTQTFADIVIAPDLEAAKHRVMHKRPYATLDRYCEGETLEAYIATLQTVAERSEQEIEKDWKEL